MQDATAHVESSRSAVNSKPESYRSRYQSDPEFRKEAKRKSKEWQDRASEIPEWMAWKAAVGRLLRRIKSKAKGKRPPRNLKSTDELREDVRATYGAWRAVMHDYKLPRAPRALSPKRIAGILKHKQDMARHAERIQAKAERAAFMAAWNEKWAHLKRNNQYRHRNKKKRDLLVKATTDPKEKTLLRMQIGHIQCGPCECYWCKKPLPKGGEVDHVVPLSKGGTNNSSNLCATCKECNARKTDTRPSEFSEQPAFL